MGDAVASSGGGMEVVPKTGEEEKQKENSLPFHPRRFLRVLLVESDDSTRRIIAAILRKCSYRVATVPDGLKAWEILKGRPHDVDLVLTEMELPSISGYALLTLITEHEVCKNIPVIMTSSQDSVSVVLKCMLKGAADFLIKPVRKNELRNLWQHVWRRQTCQQSIIGCVPETKADERQKVEVTSEDNPTTNHSSDYLDSTPQKECREKGSDAQSSSRPYLEAESAYRHNLHGLSQLEWGSGHKMSNTEKRGERMILAEKSVIPNSIIGGNSIGIELECASCNEPHNSTVFVGTLVGGRAVTTDADLGPESHNGHANNKVEVHYLANDLGEPSSGALDLIGKFDHRPNDTYGNFSANDDTKKFSFTPDLELSLRRFSYSCPKNEATDEGHISSQSNASAFSRTCNNACRYNDGKASRPLFPTLTSNELKERVTAFHNELPNHSPQNTVVTQSHGAALSSQENTSTLFTCQSGHSETAFPGPQPGFPGVKFDSFCTGFGPIFPPIFYTQSSFPPLWSPKDVLMSSSLTSSSEIHNSEQSHFPYDETTYRSAGKTMREEDNNLEFVKVLVDGSATPGLSGISSLCDGNVSKLDSGASENMCNGCDGDAIPAASSVRTFESVNDNRFFTPDGLRGLDSHCSSAREATLLKFRLKRKDRCYEKKVRYQGRKRLAEQRPRVKGQFVRQVQTYPPPPES